MTAEAPQLRGYSATKDQLIKRLRRIGGQIGGIERMVVDDRYCIDVLTQISAVQAALDRVALGLLDDHAHHCVLGAAPADRDAQDRRADGVGRAPRAPQLTTRLGPQMAERLSRESLIVALGRPHARGGPINEPLALTSTYRAGGELVYARDGSASSEAFETVIGALEGGSAVAFASGMAAAAALLETLPPGRWSRSRASPITASACSRASARRPGGCGFASSTRSTSRRSRPPARARRCSGSRRR